MGSHVQPKRRSLPYRYGMYYPAKFLNNFNYKIFPEPFLKSVIKKNKASKI